MREFQQHVDAMPYAKMVELQTALRDMEKMCAKKRHGLSGFANGGFPKIGDVVREDPGQPPEGEPLPVFEYFVAGNRYTTTDYKKADRESTCFPNRVA